MRRARTTHTSKCILRYIRTAHLCERDNVLRGARLWCGGSPFITICRDLFSHTHELYFFIHYLYFFLHFPGHWPEKSALQTRRAFGVHTHIYNVNERNKKKITMNTQLLKFPRRKVIRRLYIYCI